MATKKDPKGQLSMYTLHLTDVGGFLRQMSANDSRLADVFPRNAHAHMSGFKKPKLSEFLLTPQMQPYFRWVVVNSIYLLRKLLYRVI